MLVDIASERILLDDLVTACAQLSAGEEPSLPAATTPWATWANRVCALAADGSVHLERDLWLAPERRDPAVRLLAGATGGPPRRGDVRLVEASMSAEETAALLGFHRDRRTSLHDIVLGSVATAAARVAGSQSLLVDVQGQGRAVSMEGIDLARTVGWCTTFFPVLLTAGRRGMEAAVAAAGAALRGTPREGLAYGVLAKLYGPTAAVLGTLPQADVAVAYVGGVSAEALAEREDAVLRPSTELGMSVLSVPACLRHGVEMRAYLHAGRLHLDWWHDERACDAELIGRLADASAEALRGLGSSDPSAAPPASERWPDVSNDEIAVLFGRGE
jgi:phthiocerol/phenolphthiocerol synthesis type-I polyketide synthase E